MSEEDIIKTDKHLDLKTDGNIHYLIMNQPDNKFSIPWLNDFNSLLDKVEQTKGPGALVTIATGPKIFHTGFDLDQWKSNQIQQYESFAMCQHLLARLLTFPLPTMAVINGHTYAGGLFLALAHDIRTMRADYGFMCLSEINLGFPIPEGYTDFLRATLPPNTLRELQYGHRYNAQKSVELQLVQQMYRDRQEMWKQVQQFGKDYAPKGEHRDSLQDMKRNIYRDVYNKMLTNPLSLQGIRRVAQMK